MKKTKTNWILDVVLFFAFVIAFWLDLTGLSVHQWLGVTIGAVIGLHMILHWKWIKNVTARFFGRTSNQAKLYYVIDAALLLGLVLITITGLVISSWLNLPLENYLSWRVVHVDVSIFTLAVVVAKIGLHWRWIVKTARKHFIIRVPQPASQVALDRYRSAPSPALAYQPVKRETDVGRREFLRLMGIVGVSAFVSALGVLNEETASAQTSSQMSDLLRTLLPTDDETTAVEEAVAEQASTEAVATETVEVESTATTEATATTESETIFSQTVQTSTEDSLASASTTSCTVRCNHGCSYPGHCRRYTDTNNNNLCDLGECM